MKQYWFGCHCESEWTAGSPWQIVSASGQILDSGAIVEADPPRRLAINHTIECDPSKLIEAVSGGWPKVLCNLKR